MVSKWDATPPYSTYPMGLLSRLQEMRQCLRNVFHWAWHQVSAQEMWTVTPIFKDLGSFWGGMGILSHLLGAILGQCAWIPMMSGPQKHWSMIILKITFPAINHRYKTANTYHRHIVTHCITWWECRVESGQFGADLKLNQLKVSGIFAWIRVKTNYQKA